VADAAPVRTQVHVARAGNIGYGRSRPLVQDGPPPRPPCRAVLPKIGCRPTSVKGHNSSSSSLMSAVSRPFSGAVTSPLQARFGPASGPADPSEKDGFRWSVSTVAGGKASPEHRFAQRGHNMATIRPQMKPRRTAIGRRLSQPIERRRRRTPFDRSRVADFGPVGRRERGRTPPPTAVATTGRGHIVMRKPRCRMPRPRPVVTFASDRIGHAFAVVTRERSSQARSIVGSTTDPVSSAVPR
jgi:hypothetical protein